MAVLKSIFFFLLAGVCEISGAYLIWQWFKESKSLVFGLVGGIVLFLYVIIQTYQPANFGRVFTAYGGIYIAMAFLWGRFVDLRPTDSFDLIGVIICLVGVSVMMYWPR